MSNIKCRRLAWKSGSPPPSTLKLQSLGMIYVQAWVPVKSTSREEQSHNSVKAVNSAKKKDATILSLWHLGAESESTVCTHYFSLSIIACDRWSGERYNMCMTSLISLSGHDISLKNFEAILSLTWFILICFGLCLSSIYQIRSISCLLVFWEEMTALIGWTVSFQSQFI